MKQEPWSEGAEEEIFQGSGPPGIQPPLSFHAEQWYPSNLPTVLPPWKEAGLDIDAFRTSTIPSMTVSVTSLPAAVASDDSAALLFTAANLTFLEANETTVATSITSVLESTTVTTVNLIGDAFNSSEIPSEITEAATIFNSSEISSDTTGDARTSNSSEIFTVDSEVLKSSSNENSGEDSSSATTTDARRPVVEKLLQRVQKRRVIQY
ncbi:hypothetical protein TELCIR_14294 [Teladorsagia circumcincta]|uniref:Uncharacterized protein n=1 Tax=Teladorsagia circumcincta TaxID=45464 RepID=A0A2G9U1M5_TELCI|nr:hypothetical protein TELCIR_14294 [Teladorsagia circumcincta]